MILLFGMIKFRNVFDMIFSFPYTPLFTLIYDDKNDSYFRDDKRYISPNSEMRKQGQSSRKAPRHSEKKTIQTYRKDGRVSY